MLWTVVESKKDGTSRLTQYEAESVNEALVAWAMDLKVEGLTPRKKPPTSSCWKA